MLLSTQDIDRLLKQGYSRDFFVREQKGFYFLKNANGGCVFHDGRSCTVYNHRPRGCQLYPLIYDEATTTVIQDTYCPYHHLFPLTSLQEQQVKQLVHEIKTKQAQLKENKHQ